MEKMKGNENKKKVVPELFQLTIDSSNNSGSGASNGGGSEDGHQNDCKKITKTRASKRQNKVSKVAINNLINKKETIDTNPTALEVKNKRINRMLKQINENDVIIKNTKQKPKEFTSTPTGLRRRTLKAPNNVSIINDQ